jgi:hypothetical protein
MLLKTIVSNLNTIQRANAYFNPWMFLSILKKEATMKKLFFNVILISAIATTMVQAEGIETVVDSCRIPTKAQEHTLQSLARAVGMTYSTENCFALYEKLSDITILSIPRKGIEDIKGC